MPEPPVLDDDRIASIERLGQGVLAKIIKEFLNSTPKRIAELGAHLAAGDTTAAARTTHTLVGSTGMTGTARLSALCARIHDLAEAGDLEPARSLVGPVEAELERARTALRDLIARE
jgi:HPt (histidine-containing phosphotransfer) domain-containing protein